MAEETTATKKSTEDAKRRTENLPKAVERARRKVEKHVDRGKPGPIAAHVDPSPDSQPAE